MKFLKIAGKDISSILRNRFIRVSVVAIIIVPILYSLLYLAAFWDPYGKLEQMPVAVVNLDKGSTLNNEEVTYGKDILEELKENKKVGWNFVSNVKEAKEGLEGKKYYAVFIIPEDFSKKIANAKDGKLEKPSIQYIANEKKNLLASQINKRVASELKENITKNITDKFTEVAFDNLYEIKDGMASAADGSSKIYEGIGTMKDSIPKMQDGTVKLYDGSSKLTDGLGQLQGNLPQMSAGVGQLKTKVDEASLEFSKHPELKRLLQEENINGVKTIMKDAEALAKVDVDKIKPLMGLLSNSDKLTKILTEAETLTSVDVNSMSSLLKEQQEASQKFISTTEELNKHKSEIQKAISTNSNLSEAEKLQLAAVVEGYNTLTSEASKNMKNSASTMDEMSKNISSLEAVQKDIKENAQLISGVKSALSQQNVDYLNNLLPQLLQMKKDLKNNEKILEVAKNLLNDNNIAMAQQLIGVMPQLNGGVNKLYEASNALEVGVGQLHDGSVQLTAGLKELNSKMPELTDGVSKLYDGSKELSDKLKEGSDEISNNLKASSKDMGEFVSEPMELLEDPINHIPNYGTGFAPYFISISLWVGTLLMFFIITDKVDESIDASPASVVLGKFLSYGFIGILQAVFVSVVVLLLGLKPANVPLYFLFNILLSFVFIAIMQSLIYLLGQVGRLLAMVLFILQLTSSAGTFPLELVPGFFKALNPIMPFTYAIGGLREIISGINYSNLTENSVVLIGIMIVFIAISVVMKGHADKVQERIKDRIEVTI